MIILFISNLVMVSLGFLFGYWTNVTKVQGTIENVKNRIRKSEVGVVKRPTAEDIRKRGTSQEEEEEAMENMLDELLQ